MRKAVVCLLVLAVGAMVFGGWAALRRQHQPPEGTARPEVQSERVVSPSLGASEPKLEDGPEGGAAPSLPSEVEEPPDEPPSLTLPETDFEFEVEGKLITVTGTVRDRRTKEPIAGARVFSAFMDKIIYMDDMDMGFAEGSSEGFSGEEFDSMEGETFTEEDGSYVLFGSLSMLGDTISCEAAGFARFSKDLGATGAEQVHLDFLLDPGAAVSGRVTDRGTGKGVGGVKVLARVPQTGMGMGMDMEEGFTAKTQDDGTYLIDSLPPGSYRVTARPRPAGFIFRKEEAVSLHVREGLIYENTDLAVEPGARVQGRLTDGDGHPVKQASVSIRFADPRQMFTGGFGTLAGFEELMDLMKFSDEEGHYGIGGLDFDLEYRVSANAVGLAATISEPFSVTSGAGPAHIDIVLGKGNVVAGTVVHSDGSPAADCEVLLNPHTGMEAMRDIWDGDIPTVESAQTDGDGVFTIRGVRAGRYRLCAVDYDDDDSFCYDGDIGLAVEVDGIHDVTGLKVVLEAQGSTSRRPYGAAITGVVLDASGKPVSDVWVSASNPDDESFFKGDQTAKDGTFVIDGLSGGVYDLRASCAQGRATVEGVAVGAKVTLSLPLAASISGVVVDGQGNPVSGCAVSLRPLTEGMEDMALHFSIGPDGGVATDEQGSFEFKHGKAGRYVVRAKSAVKGAGESRELDVVPGQRVTGLRIQLQPGSAVTGVVADGAGAPVRGAEVILVPVESGPMAEAMARMMPLEMQGREASAISEEDGRFEMANVAAGAYLLRASHRAYAPAMVEDVQVAAGRDLTGLEVVLVQGGSAEGQILADGQPKAGVMIMLMGEHGQHNAVTDQDGRFNLRGVHPGSYMVHAMGMNEMMEGDVGQGLYEVRVVDIEEGAAATVDFSPPANAVAVSGVIRGQLEGKTELYLLRQGGPDLESIQGWDMAGMIEAARYTAGDIFANPDGTFQFESIAPGRYTLEVWFIDEETTGLSTTSADSGTRLSRQTIVVEEGQETSLSVDLRP